MFFLWAPYSQRALVTKICVGNACFSNFRTPIAPTEWRDQYDIFISDYQIRNQHKTEEFFFFTLFMFFPFINKCGYIICLWFVWNTMNLVLLTLSDNLLQDRQFWTLSSLNEWPFIPYSHNMWIRDIIHWLVLTYYVNVQGKSYLEA